jgi:hypothetical protein
MAGPPLSPKKFTGIKRSKPFSVKPPKAVEKILRKERGVSLLLGEDTGAHDFPFPTWSLLHDSLGIVRERGKRASLFTEKFEL